ncbi:MYB DNA-binding domain protein [Reticulomyxa filosa]|uniref:MYB DNA-binding domain protein n=1 Tax=Reticulomyxa filosa TaxID=46433 RepID=X6MKJ3_RETFI|nr:MYB DNA-binding domain protein [Reticulomyxa filosa]|eukprot:ETO14533.1 MYB DNA-binding domain protein [Reticulomyxa filosa]
MRGTVERIFVDDEGEWLEIRYGTNLVKEIPRNSTDIRPLRARFMNHFTFSKDHINRMMATWEDVDMEGTRHLDAILLDAVLRAFGLHLKVDELERVLGWIDIDNREAITADQFLAWMTSPVETLEQRDMQKRIFEAIDRTVRGELASISPQFSEHEKKSKSKLAILYNKGDDDDDDDDNDDDDDGNNNSNIYGSKTSEKVNGIGVSITSRFRPAPSPTAYASIALDQIDEAKHMESSSHDWSETHANRDNEKSGGNAIGSKLGQEHARGNDKGTMPSADSTTTSRETARSEMESSAIVMAEFSDKEDENEEDGDTVGELPSFHRAISQPQEGNQLTNLAWKLEVFNLLLLQITKLGLYGSYLKIVPTDEQHQYTPNVKQDKIEVEDKHLRRLMKDVQVYMKTRVEKAGVEGIRIYDLGQFVHKKFETFDRSNYLKGKEARFSDFVHLTPGLVVLQIEDGTGILDRIVVTEEIAKKINLKQKLEFVMAMLCDKTKITNDLTLISESNHDRHGRRLSVSEKLLNVQDFGARMNALGANFTDLERDELFWAVAGNHAHLVSQRDIGRYFGEMVDDLPKATETVLEALPRVISVKKIEKKIIYTHIYIYINTYIHIYIHFNHSTFIFIDSLSLMSFVLFKWDKQLARLKYRREPLWRNYIIKQCRKRWNNVMLVTVLDRRTRMRQMDMIIIPRTNSPHGEDLLSVQRSFHYMCHVLNKLQYSTVVKKLDHGADKFAYSCITDSPNVRSFPEMLLESRIRRIAYTEHFVAQVVGSLMETILFCHKHNCVNLNLNVGLCHFFFFIFIIKRRC